MQRLKSWQLFAICVGVWGTTWHAITYQVSSGPPELAVAMRFALAGGCILGWCALRGERLRFGARAHVLFALQGVFLYSLSYVCVYHAEQHVPSGLVAIGYSASPLLNGLAARVLWQVPVSRRFVAGGVLGLVGVATIFAPELAAPSAVHGGTDGARSEVWLGVVFTAASVLLSSMGSLTASRNRAQGLPLWPALGYGMVYSAVSTAAVLWWQLRGAPATATALLPAAASWWIALVYLALVGSVATFAAWFTLQDRVGPGPSSAVGVAAPVCAIAVSVALEGFRPGWLTGLGMLLAVAGNWWMLVPPTALRQLVRSRAKPMSGPTPPPIAAPRSTPR